MGCRRRPAGLIPVPVLLTGLVLLAAGLPTGLVRPGSPLLPAGLAAAAPRVLLARPGSLLLLAGLVRPAWRARLGHSPGRGNGRTVLAGGPRRMR